MRLPRNPLLTLDAPRPENRRRHGRMHAQDVRCTLGTVQDLSGGGMRIRAWRTPPPVGATCAITLQGFGAPIAIGVRIMWHRRIGLFRHEFGAEFLPLGEPQRRAIMDLARACSRAEVIRPSIAEDAARSAADPF